MMNFLRRKKCMLFFYIIFNKLQCIKHNLKLMKKLLENKQTNKQQKYDKK